MCTWIKRDTFFLNNYPNEISKKLHLILYLDVTVTFMKMSVSPSIFIFGPNGWMERIIKSRRSLSTIQQTLIQTESHFDICNTQAEICYH